MGFLGYRLGFAPAVHLPELVGEPGSGLATGARIVISLPRAVFQAGLERPMWMMLGFVMISFPAAGLGAARPQTPGGPRQKSSVQVIAASGAVMSMISGILLILINCKSEGRISRGCLLAGVALMCLGGLVRGTGINYSIVLASPLILLVLLKARNRNALVCLSCLGFGWLLFWLA